MEKVMKSIQIKGINHPTEIRMECFENGGEIVKVCEKRPKQTGFYKNHFDPNYSYDMGFEGVHNIKEAKGMLAEGWTEKVEEIKQSMHSVERKNYSLKASRMKADVVGYMPIVPNAIMGLPNSMLNTDMKPKKNKVINIVYGLSFSAYVNKEDIKKYGMMLMERIIRLEAEGFRVRLTCAQNYQTDNKLCHVMTCKVKSEDQPMDALRVMFPMFHPAMFRAIGFGWYETFPEGQYIDGYGKPLYYTMSEESVDDMAEQLFGRTAVYIDGMFIEKKGAEYIDRKLGVKTV